MRRSIISKINVVLNIPDVVEENVHVQAYAIKSEKPSRCSTCLDNIRGEGYTAKVQALGRSVKQCSECGNAVCENHYI